MRSDEGIAIVGMDCRYPGANNINEYWENILSLRKQFRSMPEKRLDLKYYGSEDHNNVDTTYSKKAAVLTGYYFDRIKYKVAKSTFEQTDMVHWLALDVAAGALKDAGFENGIGLNKKNVGVIIGNSLNGEFTRANQMRLRWPYVFKVLESTLSSLNYRKEEISQIIQNAESVYKEPFPVPDADTLAGGLSNTIAGRICNYFDFNGGGYTVDGACSSSLLAVTNGCNAILNEEIEVALVGGVDLSIDPFEVIGFARNGALATQEMEVFSNRSQGFWPGEGCGIIVLMKESEAIKKGLNIYSVIRGWGISSDGKGGMTRPKPETQQLAIQRTYQKAKYSIKTIDMFEAHGTGTPLGDQVELTALINELKSTNQRDKTPTVGSVKHLIGHTKAAAGIAGVIKASLAVKNKVIPSSKIQGDLHPVLVDNKGVLELIKTPKYLSGKTPMRASVSSFGFGGINVHLTMEGCKKEVKAKKITNRIKTMVNAPRDYEVFPFTEYTKEGVLKKLETLKEVVSKISYAEFTDLSISMTSGFKNTGKWKVSLIANKSDKLLENIDELITIIQEEKETLINSEKGIFFNAVEDISEVAFLFPGQGSPVYRCLGGFANLCKELWDHELGYNEPYKDLNIKGVVDTSIAQPEIVRKTTQSLDMLANLGIEAEYGIGHSLGEISALHWADVICKKQTREIAIKRGKAMSEYGDDKGAMLALRCEENQLKDLISEHKVTITGYNGAGNYVIGGALEEISKVELKAFEKELRCSRLKVSHAFHTPMMRKAADYFKDSLADWSFKKASKPVISTVTGQMLKQEVDYKQHLYEQIEKPVQFTQAVDKIKEKVRLFIEVGPGNTLAKSLRSQKDIDVVSLDFGNPCIKGLLEVMSAAFVVGKDVLFEELSFNRFHRALDMNTWELDVLVNPCEKTDHKKTNILDIINNHKAKASTTDSIETTSIKKTENSELGVLMYIKQLVSEKTEIPIQAITDSDRIMSQLHLNSLTITEIVSLVAKAFNKSHKVFSEASILANADGTIVELSKVIYQGENGQNQNTQERKFDFEKINHWTHVFKRHSIPKKRTKIAINESEGVVTIKDYTAFTLDWETEINKLKLPIGNGFVFVYDTNQGENIAYEFLSFLKNPELLKSDFILVLEITEGIVTVDLKPIFRTFKQEYPEIKMSVLSLHNELEGKKELLIEELKVLFNYKEVSYDQEKIRTELECSLYFPDDHPISDMITEGDVILATGGGKGITFESIFALAIETQAKLAIFGRSNQEDDEALKRNLQILTESNIQYRYYAVDVCDKKSVKEAIHKIKQEWKSIQHIVHGAGVNTPKLIQELVPQDFHKTSAVKVNGLKNIMDHIDPKQLKLLVGYGSIIAQSGMRGNADYAWANDQLALYIQGLDKKYDHCRCITLEWSVWDGTGMGVALNSIENLKQQGIWPIPIHDGIKQLKAILSDTKNSGRYIITSRFGGIPTLAFSKSRLPLGRFISKIKHHIPQVELVSEVSINLKEDIYLKNHVFKGQYVFPTVMILEGMAQCSQVLYAGESTSWSFQDLKINKSIFIPEKDINTLRFIISRITQNSFQAVVLSEDSNYEVHCFEATIVLNPEQDSKIVLDHYQDKLSEPLDFDVEKSFYDDLLFHHGPFRRIKNFLSIQALSSNAVAHSNSKDSWFGAFVPEDLTLGDPGLNDAAIHCHQASRPAQSLLPTAVHKIWINPEKISMPLSIRTIERFERGNETVIDVFVTNKDGEIQQMWQGLTLTSVSGVKHQGAWNAILLVPYLEYTLTGLAKVHMSITLEQSEQLIFQLQENGISAIQQNSFIIELETEERTSPELQHELMFNTEIKIQNIPGTVRLRIYQLKEVQSLT